MTDKEKAARAGTLAASNTALSDENPTKKIDRVLAALRHPAGLNRFEAERLGDHTINSTVAALRERGIAISSRWEVVPTRYNPKGVRVLRYWITEAS